MHLAKFYFTVLASQTLIAPFKVPVTAIFVSKSGQSSKTVSIAPAFGERDPTGPFGPIKVALPSSLPVNIMAAQNIGASCCLNVKIESSRSGVSDSSSGISSTTPRPSSSLSSLSSAPIASPKSSITSSFKSPMLTKA
uniref:CSON001551 protein n=1 Tax=Culicoides sonorensis TaxID=179676 RepID=A0A336MKW5_CULSO